MTQKEKNDTHSLNWSAWLFSCAYLIIPSFAMLERTLAVLLDPDTSTRSLILLLYLLILVVAGNLIVRRLWQAIESRLNERDGVIVFFITLAILVIGFSIFYPLADSGELGFYSDRDEALDIGVRALLAGDYPYYCKAVSGIHYGCPEEGSPIGPLPGALLFATPFVMLGSSAYQSFFWFGVLFCAAARFLRGTRTALLYCWTLLLFAPVILAEIFSGGDLIANSIWIAVLMLLLITRPRQPVWPVFACALLLGIALSCRAHFLLILPGLGTYLLMHYGWRHAVAVMACIAAGFLFVTLPFYLADPGAFGPLSVQQKLKRFQDLLPFGQEIATAASVLWGIVMGARAKTPAQILHVCAAAILIPIIFAVGLNSVSAGTLTFHFYGWYALSALFFGSLAVWIQHSANDLAQQPFHPDDVLYSSDKQ